MPKPITQYLLHQISAEQPIKRLIRLHKIGISACEERNEVRLTKVLILLNNSLKAEQWPELANNLANIYSHLFSCIQIQDYPQIHSILLKLLNQWQQQCEQHTQQ